MNHFSLIPNATILPEKKKFVPEQGLMVFCKFLTTTSANNAIKLSSLHIAHVHFIQNRDINLEPAL